MDVNTQVGTTPDILIEFSVAGNIYLTSSATKPFQGDVACTKSSISRTVIECEMDAFPMQYLGITSQNGKSFEFKEIEAIASK